MENGVENNANEEQGDNVVDAAGDNVNGNVAAVTADVEPQTALAEEVATGDVAAGEVVAEGFMTDEVAAEAVAGEDASDDASMATVIPEPGVAEEPAPMPVVSMEECLAYQGTRVLVLGLG